MPIKYNLTKYDMLSTRIKKVSVRNPTNGMAKADHDVMMKAILIASFASGHSWQTYRAITSKPPTAINRPEIKQEYQEAVTSKWRMITPFDIVEVSTTNVPENAFSQWLFFVVDKDYREEFKNAWTELQMEFNQDCDVIERKE